MPLTQLDTKVALVVIDLQKGIVAMQAEPNPTGDVVRRAAELARAFRECGLPVVLVNVTGGAPGRTDAGPFKGTFAPDWAELVAELDQQPSDLLVTKKTWGAFMGTELDALLRERGVTQIVLCGVATSIGVESTARWAYELGYNVVLAADAMSDRSAEAHQNSVERIFPRLGEVEGTEGILGKLKG